MNFKIILPENYEKIPFPSYNGVTLESWCEELESGNAVQGRTYLSGRSGAGNKSEIYHCQWKSYSSNQRLTMKKPEYLIVPDNYVRKPLPMKRKWVEALRSGEYKQAGNALKSSFGYCCLGVLCELQGRLVFETEGRVNKWTDEGQGSILNPNNPLVEFLESWGTFPGNTSEDTIIYCLGEDDRTSRALTEMNDSGYSFVQIADVIDFLWFDPENETP